MFVNKTCFKRQVKEAYNSNRLKVGHICGGFVVDSGHWVVWGDEYTLPNWMKAALVELIGELPRDGHMFQYGKGELERQILSLADDYDLPKIFMCAREPHIVLPVVIGNKYTEARLLQRKSDKNISALPEHVYQLIDFSNMESGESRPAGPSTVSHGSVYFWKNDQCVLALRGIELSGEKTGEIMRLLSQIDF